MTLAEGSRCMSFRPCATLPLPGSHTRAVWALALFIAVQFADAAQTVYGISRFGPAIEANPILSMCIAAFGAGTALFGAKMVAVIGGAALHVCSYHFVLVVLTVAYVFGAVVPWALVLGP